MRPPSVIVVGGGLAGCSAALALARRGIHVTLFESRRRLGGRAGSFDCKRGVGEIDSSESMEIDYCQHVGMGCCTNLRQLISWLGQGDDWCVHRELHFYGPSGKYQKLKALPLLPAPAHLANWLLRWPGLRIRDRIGIARAMLAIQRLKPLAAFDAINALAWLHEQNQTPESIERFWNTIIVSALGEETSRVSLSAVCKVMQDGFMNHRDAFHLLVPQKPLAELFGRRVQTVFSQLRVNVRCGASVDSVDLADPDRPRVLVNGQGHESDGLVVAVPWHKFGRLVPASSSAEVLQVAERAGQLSISPISGIHTWWDKPWLEHPHATLIGRLCQWVFPHQDDRKTSGKSREKTAYYQIVISASRQLPLGADKTELGKLIQADLAQVFPGVMNRTLLDLRVVTDRQAVFSVAPGVNLLRPETLLSPRCALAGDWTRTGWPATMEGAILSGFRAADCLRAAMLPANGDRDECPSLGK